jgi:hypothetical protein
MAEPLFGAISDEEWFSYDWSYEVIVKAVDEAEALAKARARLTRRWKRHGYAGPLHFAVEVM